jgi:cytochrome c-type biogenesis protein CcmH/NrfG
MQPGERFILSFKIILPFLVLALLNFSPVSSVVRKDLQAARIAGMGSLQVAEPSATTEPSAQPEAVAGALQRVLTREPWRLALLDLIGRAELAAGRAPEAIGALRQAERAGTLSVEGRFQLGEAYLRQGDDRVAEAAWQSLLRLEGPSPRVFDRLVQVRRARRDYPAVIETLRAWRSFDPQDPHVTFLLGMYLSTVQPDEAAPLLVEAAQRDTRYTAAVQVLRRGLAQAGNSEQPATGWVMIGRALASIEQWDLAAETFQRAVTAMPANGDAWAYLGEARYHLGGAGQTELERANALAPESTTVRALLALYWYRQEKPEKALEYLQDIARKEPKDPKWQVNIGSILAETGDLNAAREAYQKAVNLAPDNSLYWQYLAGFSANYYVDPHALGLPAARQAILLAPGDPGALDAMGLMLLRLEDDASAERFLQQALEKDATYAPASLHMGQLYLKQDDAGRAYLYLKRAANLGGKNSIGLTARRLLSQYYGEGG